MPKKNKNEEEEIIRVKMPKNDETIGVVTAMLGGGRLEVKCEDGFTRICRIPGKIKRRLWIKPGYLVLVKPWSVQKEERADVIWLYSKAQSSWLKRKGFIKNISPEL
ncbi:MAG: translation initiation factor eIF-1A [Candidatus Aenigmarchaeota archaeon]|nr:translation initiation factor eIF-1A [Candidatus Aenigmarchaeota archaeon]